MNTTATIGIAGSVIMGAAMGAMLGDVVAGIGIGIALAIATGLIFRATNNRK